MKLLRQYRFVLLVLFLTVVLVLFRSFSRTGFRYDAARWAKPSVHGSNLLTVNQLPALAGDIMLLNLGGEADMPDVLQDKAVSLSAESITGKSNLKLIRQHRGSVILFSDDSSVSARVWMVLAEMGMENVYILRVSGSKAD